MTTLSLLLQGAAIGVSAALSPGPFQSLIIAQSLIGGWRKAAPIIFAPLLADIPIALVLVFILKQVPQIFLLYVRFAGAALLFYLAWNLWRQIRSNSVPIPDQSPAASPVKHGLLMGMAMLFLSPGPYIYWSLVLGPLLVSALAISIWHALAFIIGFYTLSIGGLLLMSIFLSRLGESSALWRRRLQIASLILMLVIAIFLIASAFSV